MARLHRRFDGPEDAPVVVLSSSLGATGAMWEPQIGPLAERFRVLSYDHRGHGGSEVPDGPYALADLGADVVGMLDEEDLATVSFVGLSLGGMVGMWLGIHAPERIERLGLLCTSAKLGPPSNWDDRIGIILAGGMEAIGDATMERWFTAAYRSDHADDVARWRAMLVAAPSEGYMGCCAAIRDMDLIPGLSSVVAATLVIAGDQDPATNHEHTDAIAAGIPGARLETVGPAAHFANVEQPQATNALLLDHLTAA